MSLISYCIQLFFEYYNFILFNHIRTDINYLNLQIRQHPQNIDFSFIRKILILLQ